MVGHDLHRLRNIALLDRIDETRTDVVALDADPAGHQVESPRSKR